MTCHLHFYCVDVWNWNYWYSLFFKIYYFLALLSINECESLYNYLNVVEMVLKDEFNNGKTQYMVRDSHKMANNGQEMEQNSHKSL